MTSTGRTYWRFLEARYVDRVDVNWNDLAQAKRRKQAKRTKARCPDADCPGLPLRIPRGGVRPRLSVGASQRLGGRRRGHFDDGADRHE